MVEKIGVYYLKHTCANFFQIKAILDKKQLQQAAPPLVCFLPHKCMVGETERNHEREFMNNDSLEFSLTIYIFTHLYVYQSGCFMNKMAERSSGKTQTESTRNIWFLSYLINCLTEFPPILSTTINCPRAHKQSEQLSHSHFESLSSLLW